MQSRITLPNLSQRVQKRLFQSHIPPYFCLNPDIPPQSECLSQSRLVRVRAPLCNICNQWFSVRSSSMPPLSLELFHIPSVKTSWTCSCQRISTPYPAIKISVIPYSRLHFYPHPKFHQTYAGPSLVTASNNCSCMYLGRDVTSPNGNRLQLWIHALIGVIE